MKLLQRAPEPAASQQPPTNVSEPGSLTLLWWLNSPGLAAPECDAKPPSPWPAYNVQLLQASGTLAPFQLLPFSWACAGQLRMRCGLAVLLPSHPHVLLASVQVALQGHRLQLCVRQESPHLVRCRR